MATRAERREATRNRLKAMQHPLRAEAFALIRERGPLSPAQLARELETDVQTISYHVRKLTEYECVEEVGNRPVRGAVEHFYRATEQARVDRDDWLELAQNEPEMAEVLTDEFMQKIVDDFSESRRAQIVGRDEEFWITRTNFILDKEGLGEAREASAAYEAAMNEIASRSAARRIEKGTDEDDFPVSSSIAFFKMPPRRE